MMMMTVHFNFFLTSSLAFSRFVLLHDKKRARERDESRVGERAHPHSSFQNSHVIVIPHHALHSVVESLLHRTRGKHRAKRMFEVEISLTGIHHRASKASFQSGEDDDDDDVINARRQTREEHSWRRKQLE